MVAQQQHQQRMEAQQQQQQQVKLSHLLSCKCKPNIKNHIFENSVTFYTTLNQILNNLKNQLKRIW